MKKLVLLFVSITYCLSIIGQDNQYSQFYSAQLYLNPAFAGTKMCPRAIINFRDQWPGISGEYVSYGLSYDQSLLNNSGIGIVLNCDDAGQGTIKTNSVNFIYSTKILLNKNLTLSVAMSGGVIQKKLDASSLIFPNQIDNKGIIIGVLPEIQNDINKVVADINAGLILYSDLFHLGYASHHLIEPLDILYTEAGKLYRKHTVHFGINYIKSNKFNHIIKHDQYFSRIYINDLVNVLLASMKKPNPINIYNVADDMPSSMSDVVDFICQRTSCSIPKKISFEDLDADQKKQSFYSENKRINNRLLKEDLGIILKYPSYREGYEELIENDN